MASFAGFAFIGACVGMCAWIVPAQDLAREIWIFAFLAIAACSKFSWRHPKAPQTPSGWCKVVGVALGVGVILFATDVVVYGPRSGHVALDVFAASFGVVVAVSGAIRSFILGHRADA